MSFIFPQNLQDLLKERSLWREQRGQQDLRELERRIEALTLPENRHMSVQKGVVCFEAPEALAAAVAQEVEAIARELIPWRKGPFNFFGLEVDAEWRSDFKWERFSKYLPAPAELARKRVLDVGCNNGYFMFQLKASGADHVLGIDPVAFNEVQFKFLQKLAGQNNLQFEMLGVEHLSDLPAEFDLILSMGVLYHHRHPIEQLQMLKAALKPGGELILESIVIPSQESVALFPEDRYAKMRNVWFVPSVSCLENMLKRCNFKEVELLHFGKTTTDEQRLTKWCPPPKQSLADFLDPQNDELTIEGHPAPYRAIFKARIG